MAAPEQGGNVTVRLVNRSGNPVASVTGVGAKESRWSADASIPVVVGETIFADESSSTKTEEDHE